MHTQGLFFARIILSIIMFATLCLGSSSTFADSAGSAGTSASWGMSGYATRANDGVGGSYGGEYWLESAYWCVGAVITSVGVQFSGFNPLTGGCSCPSGYTAYYTGFELGYMDYSIGGNHAYYKYTCYKK